MSDLDEEELKATREMKAINKIIAPEEKSADEMFEELDYKKYEGLKAIDYYGKYGSIGFEKDYQFLNIVKYEDTDYITMQELKAINKKCKELGWIE